MPIYWQQNKKKISAETFIKIKSVLKFYITKFYITLSKSNKHKNNVQLI